MSGLSRRRVLLSAAYAALAALTGCKLRVENPLLRFDGYPHTMAIRLVVNDQLIVERDPGWILTDEADTGITSLGDYNG